MTSATKYQPVPPFFFAPHHYGYLILHLLGDGARCVHLVFVVTGRRLLTQRPRPKSCCCARSSSPPLPSTAQLEQRDDSDSRAVVTADSQLSRSSARGANGKDRRRQMGQVCALNARRLLVANRERGTQFRRDKDSANYRIIYAKKTHNRQPHIYFFSCCNFTFD